MWTLTADSELWEEPSDSMTRLRQDHSDYIYGHWQLAANSEKTSVMASEGSDEIIVTIHVDSDSWCWALTIQEQQI